MAVTRRRRHHNNNHLFSTAAVTFLFLCLFLFSTAALAQLGSQKMTKAVRDINYKSYGGKVVVGSRSGGSVKASSLRLDRFTSQKRMGGPGSSPPTCRSKCGVCAPCRPVHVPVQPGVSFPLEYYPEAWRCQCGTKLFMP